MAQVAAAVGVARQTLLERLRRAAAATPQWTDRSSQPQRSPTRLPRHRRRQIDNARRRRWSSPRIAQHLQLPLSTVVTHVRRVDLARLPDLAPAAPVRRYENAYPGELLHLDVKKLEKIGRVGHRIHGERRARVRGIGWEFLHVAIDDHSRLAYAEVLANETGATAAGFLQRATAWLAGLGIPIERLLTDIGGCYQSLPFATTTLALGIGQRFTAPYRPQSKLKAAGFIRTMLAD